MRKIKFRKKSMLSLLVVLSLVALYIICIFMSLPQNKDYLPQKRIIFEGAYDGISSENLESNGSALNSHEYSIIKFFADEPAELDLIELDRPTPTDSIEIVQEKLAVMRNTTKSIIINHNLKLLDDLSSLSERDQFIIGEYCSVVKLLIPTNNISSQYIKNVNYLVQKSDLIDEVYISEFSFENCDNELANALPAIHVDQMINSGQFTGRNINVGIIEANSVLRNTTFPDYNNRNITTRTGDTGTSDHSDHVAMIAVGNNGIARGSNIFVENSRHKVQDYLDWMINNNVNVINTSFGTVDENISGTYSSAAREVDSIIRNSFITLVGSAGNSNTSPSLRVTSPKTAFNTITVGNSGLSTQFLAGTSCFREQTSYGGSKPNVVAPGTTRTNSYNGQSRSGTSFAAPQVTGCIALLMEEFPYLVAYPELCLSIVTASASPMSDTYNTTTSGNTDNKFDSSGLHNQIGSGLLNYEQMRVAARNYLSVTRKASSPSGMLSESLTFTATKNQRVRASLAWLAQGQDENNITDYDLFLQKVNNDGTYSTLMRINGSTNNVEFLDYSFKFDGTYRLAINQYGTNAKKDFIGLSYVLIDQTVGGSISGGQRYELSNKLTPSDYGFNEEYNFNEISSSVTTTTGQTIAVKRLRCGYISDTYLALSAKRNNAGRAYLEYQTPYHIYGVKYDLGLWSDNESLILNSSIRLEAKDLSGNWHTIRVFNPKQMSTDKDNLLTYYDIIPYQSTCFRFIVETNQVQNENNRGRVVIGNIDIVQIN